MRRAPARPSLSRISAVHPAPAPRHCRSGTAFRAEMPDGIRQDGFSRHHHYRCGQRCNVFGSELRYRSGEQVDDLPCSPSPHCALQDHEHSPNTVPIVEVRCRVAVGEPQDASGATPRHFPYYCSHCRSQPALRVQKPHPRPGIWTTRCRGSRCTLAQAEPRPPLGCGAQITIQFGPNRDRAE